VIFDFVVLSAGKISRLHRTSWAQCAPTSWNTKR